MARRVLLAFVAASAVVLVPWTAYLARTLPNRHDSDQWRIAWVGFDLGLVGLFAAAAVLGLRRHRTAVPLLAATAALLCADAWFDVVLDWAQPDRWASLLMAVFAEVPIALVLLRYARAVPAGGMRVHRLTAHDIGVRGDPATGAVLVAVHDLAPARTEAVADRLGWDRHTTGAALHAATAAGCLRRTWTGRWRPVGPVDVRLPRPDEVDAADRSRVAAYVDAKFDRELDLFAWAARHRDEFGPWALGERTVAHLTRADLSRLGAEYNELITRYSLRHTTPGQHTREIAVRFYAFPTPDGRG